MPKTELSKSKSDSIPGVEAVRGVFNSERQTKKTTDNSGGLPDGKDVPTSQIRKPGANPKALNNPTRNGTHFRPSYETLFGKDKV